MSLKDQLENIKKQSGEQLPHDVLEKFDTFSEYVNGLEIESKCAQVGDAAPPFSLPLGGGGQFTLAEALSNGPVVALFFRGRW